MHVAWVRRKIVVVHFCDKFVALIAKLETQLQGSGVVLSDINLRDPVYGNNWTRCIRVAPSHPHEQPLFVFPSWDVGLNIRARLRSPFQRPQLLGGVHSAVRIAMADGAQRDYPLGTPMLFHVPRRVEVVPR
jgi:hypothetical protein